MLGSCGVVIVLSFASVLAPCLSLAQDNKDNNYPGRQAVVVNMCPFVELVGFHFQNKHRDPRDRFETGVSWKNIGKQPLIAFEIVILKYDAFDRRLIGERWTVTGVNSVDWRPLQPGAQSSDGRIGAEVEEVFTAIAYVRAARLADNTVWSVDESQLIKTLGRVPGGIKDFGELKSDPKPKPQ